MRGLVTGLMLCMVALTAAAQEAEFPRRPITMVVPYPPGGVTDTMARVLAERMRAPLGQSVVVENAGGASGSIGVGRVVRAAADGHTLLLGNADTNVINGAAMQLPYDVVNDLDPVALLPSYTFIVVSKNALPAANAQELVHWLRASQGKALQGTVGDGTVQHLCGVLMQQIVGAKWDFVPYRGGAPAMQDLLAGQFDIMCTASGSILALIRSGQVRAHAVAARARLESAPQIPTVDEVGIPNLYVAVWNAFWVPKGTPKAAIAKLNAAAVQALAEPAIRKRFVDMGLDMPAADQGTPEALYELQRAEVARWWPLIKAIKGAK